MSDINQIPKEIRKRIFEMIYKAGGGHIAPAFSVAEIMTSLYFKVMKYDPKYPKMEDRDIFILSKGHASAALYATLQLAGFFDKSHLDTFCKCGSILGGHPNMHEIPGVEASTGALGHGFPFAVGIALAGKMDGKDYNTYAVLGDGECQEGTIWEAAMFASHQKIGKMTAIVDYNKLQAMEPVKSILELEPFVDKWKSFGWDVFEVDGHNVEELVQVLSKERKADDKPRVIIAHTIKGKGVSFMEGVPLWHYRMPNEEELKIVMSELGISKEELMK